MGLYLDQNALRYSRSSNQIIINFSLLIAVFVLFLALCAGRAWAVEPQNAYNANNPLIHQASFGSPHKKLSPPAAANTCIPLLNSVHLSPSGEVADRNQRSAGHVAVLGLALGMRFALEPSPNQPRKTLDKGFEPVSYESEQNIDNKKALNIIQYRHCLKERALLSQLQ